MGNSLSTFSFEQMLMGFLIYFWVSVLTDVVFFGFAVKFLFLYPHSSLDRFLFSFLKDTERLYSKMKS